MPQQNLADNTFEKEGNQNLESNNFQTSPDKLDQGITGGEIHENKDELQKIIERNRQQVENLDGEFEIEKQQEAKEKIDEQFRQEKLETASSSSPAKDDDQDEEQQQHVKSHAETVYQISDPEQQIEHIVQLAITKDPYFAVKVARHLDDNYILNEIHDRLVEDQVRDELIKRGLLKES